MFGTQGRFEDRQGLRVALPRRRQPPLPFVEHGKVVQQCGDLRVRGSKQAPLDVDCPVIALLRLVGSVGRCVQSPKVAEVDRDLIVVRTVVPLERCKCLVEDPFGLVVALLAMEHRSQDREAGRHLGVTVAKYRRPQLHGASSRLLGLEEFALGVGQASEVVLQCGPRHQIVLHCVLQRLAVELGRLIVVGGVLVDEGEPVEHPSLAPGGQLGVLGQRFCP